MQRFAIVSLASTSYLPVRLVRHAPQTHLLVSVPCTGHSHAVSGLTAEAVAALLSQLRREGERRALDGSPRELLRVVRHEGGSRATLAVVCAVAAVLLRVARSAMKDLGGEHAHAAEGAVQHELHVRLPLVDRVVVVTQTG